MFHTFRLFSFLPCSPSVMIWIIAGVLYYDTGKSDVLLGLGIPLMGLFLLYIASCLYTKPDFHRAFAKGGSYILSIVVFVLAVVSIVNIIKDPKKTLGTDDPTYHLDKKIGLSVSLLYLIIYGGVFVATVLLHPTEIYCCLQSLWYLLCLPAFNIFLVTYSVCNLNKSNLGKCTYSSSW